MIYPLPKVGPRERAAAKANDELRAALRYSTAEPSRWVGTLRRLVFARAVQGSNSIEGYNATIDDVLDLVYDEEPMDASDETSSALQGYRDAMTYVLQLHEEDGLRIDTTLIKSLHFMMVKHELRKRPGRWRAGGIFVRRDPDGVVVYEGPDWDEVPALMEEVALSLEHDEGHVLVRAAMAHLNLVMVHPFADGNGRMGRCLQTLVLARDRILSPVFASIEEYLGGHTQAYYDVLGRVGKGGWHPEHDARPWVRFCLNAHYQQARLLQWRIDATEELWGRMEDVVEKHKLPARAVGPLCDAAQGLRLRNAGYRRAVREAEGEEISDQTASIDLRRLVQAGLLAAKGETRGRRYEGRQEVRKAWADIRRTRPEPEELDLFAR